MIIEAKYKRSDVDALINKKIEFVYNDVLSTGKITRTDFNENFEMAYGIVSISEDYIDFTVGIEKIKILELE